MRVKNSKSQVTVCFPIEHIFWQTLKDWIEELRSTGLKDDDALFPPDADLGNIRALKLENRSPIATWSTAEGVRRAFRRGCDAAGLLYINPHLVRHSLAEHGRQVCRSLIEEQAWSHNLGHESVETTRNHYAKITDEHRDETFAKMGKRDQTPEEDKDLLIRYFFHETVLGTPEDDRAARLVVERMAATQKRDKGTWTSPI